VSGAGSLGGADSNNPVGTFGQGVTLHGGVDGLALLVGDATNVLAIRNGNSNQQLNIYSEYTNPTNWSRLELAKQGIGLIQTNHDGTGSVNDLYFNSDNGNHVFQSGGTDYFQLSPAALYFVQDNTTNIGNAGLFRPKTIYAATSFQADALGTASGSGNFGSADVSTVGSYWTGSVAATDQWSIATVLGTGTNPTSTLTITHTGSSGKASIDLENVATATSASAGSNGAVPAQVAAYLDITVNGTAYKMPLFLP
jgi:hypothetical protein